MAVDKTVLDAITAAVKADSENAALRLHLASLLFEDNQYSESLAQCKIILAEEPADIKTLEIAAGCAEKLGDLGKAQSYRKILAALNSQNKAAPDVSAAGQNKHSSANGEWADILTDEPDLEAVPLRDGTGEFGDDDFMFEAETPALKLADVAGMETVKKRLNLAFLAPLKNPEMMQLFGKSLRGGLLLYGAPGCGKTFIARAVAGELGAKFISVGLSDVLDMWIGSSEKNVHAIFQRARRFAPCVLFFDEVDALGRKRSLSQNSSHGAINQLLAELDGVNQENDGVFVLAATNHPWDVDTALRRPGRLDRTLLVLPPDLPARMSILEFHLRERPLDQTINLKTIAENTKEFSGADLAHLVESAAEFAMEDSLLSGNVRSISQKDFVKALREVKSSTRPWFEVAKNYAMFANDGGIYDDLLEYLKQNRLL